MLFRALGEGIFYGLCAAAIAWSYSNIWWALLVYAVIGILASVISISLSLRELSLKEQNESRNEETA